MTYFEMISTIEKQDNGKFTLVIYMKGKVLFREDYDTFRVAKMVETKMLHKFRLA